MRLAVLVVSAIAVTAVASRSEGQAVDPPFEVHQGQARSSFSISNGSLTPLSFVIEARSFDIASCGDLGFKPLDTARVRVRLSTMSGRLPARQQRRIEYDVTAGSLPAWVAFVVTFGSAGRAPGLGTRMQVVHFAYLNQRAPILPQDVAILEASYDAARRRVTVTVENHSDKLTRVLLMSLVDRGGREHPIEACPFLPQRRRTVDVPWTLAQPPTRVIIQFPGFSLEAPVVPRVGPDSAPPR